MDASPRLLFAIIWIGWLASWMTAAAWSSRAQKRAATAEVLIYRLLTLLGAVLLAVGGRRTWIGGRIWTGGRIWNVGVGSGYALAALTLAGILFAWWARIHLGCLWSAAITRKEDHRVVDSGPYALVRHPIYSGLIAAIAATAAAEGTPDALLGAALVACGLWLKARIEERFLTAELGADYRRYRRRVPMLLPFLRRRSGISGPR